MSFWVTAGFLWCERACSCLLCICVERQVVVVPFVTNILVSAADSVVFRPPNPWTMGLVDLLSQIYNADLPTVKLVREKNVLRA